MITRSTKQTYCESDPVEYGELSTILKPYFTELSKSPLFNPIEYT